MVISIRVLYKLLQVIIDVDSSLHFANKMEVLFFVKKLFEILVNYIKELKIHRNIPAV